MKRFLPLLLSLLLLACFPLNAFAEDGLSIQITGVDDSSYVVDNGHLLSEGEKNELTQIAEEISRRQQCDVVILTENSLDGNSPEAYADDYFDYNGYGYGPDRSGILFLLSMEERDWYISTRGDAIQAFTDDGIDYLWSKCSSNISGGRYADGFLSYLNTADTMLSAYNGTLSEEALRAFQDDFNAFTGNGNDSPPVREKPSVVKTTIIALVVGFLLAFIGSASLKSQLKSVRMKYNATNYRRGDSMYLNTNRDIYLYTNTTSRVIETQQRTGGGGSSTHISSSGASHGGHGGKF